MGLRKSLETGDTLLAQLGLEWAKTVEPLIDQGRRYSTWQPKQVGLIELPVLFSFYRTNNSLRLTRKLLDRLIKEELSKTDKSEIRSMISKEVNSAKKDFEKKLKKDVEKEVEKMLRDKATKEEIGDITKKLQGSHHPYIIDRIKI
jgi:hypothetical protein